MSQDGRGLLQGVVPTIKSVERINTSTVSARTATDLPPWSTVRLLASVDTQIRFCASNGAAVVATDMTLVAGFPEILSNGELARVAAILASGTGTLEVTVLA